MKKQVTAEEKNKLNERSGAPSHQTEKTATTATTKTKFVFTPHTESLTEVIEPWKTF